MLVHRYTAEYMMKQHTLLYKAIGKAKDEDEDEDKNTAVIRKLGKEK